MIQEAEENGKSLLEVSSDVTMSDKERVKLIKIPQRKIDDCMYMYMYVSCGLGLIIRCIPLWDSR